MEAIKLNDYVYSKFGYGVVIEKVSPLEADNTRLKQDDTSPKNTETILPEEFAKVKYNWGGLGYLQVNFEVLFLLYTGVSNNRIKLLIQLGKGSEEIN